MQYAVSTYFYRHRYESHFAVTNSACYGQLPRLDLSRLCPSKTKVPQVRCHRMMGEV